MLGKVLTVKETAKLMGCDDRQVLYWIATGELAAFSIAKNKTGMRNIWRIDESELTRFVESRKHPAAIRRQTPSVVSRKRPILKKYV